MSQEVVNHIWWNAEAQVAICVRVLPGQHTGLRFQTATVVPPPSGKEVDPWQADFGPPLGLLPVPGLVGKKPPTNAEQKPGGRQKKPACVEKKPAAVAKKPAAQAAVAKKPAADVQRRPVASRKNTLPLPTAKASREQGIFRIHAERCLCRMSDTGQPWCFVRVPRANPSAASCVLPSHRWLPLVPGPFATLGHVLAPHVF
jgi:hypothetical protein